MGARRSADAYPTRMLNVRILKDLQHGTSACRRITDRTILIQCTKNIANIKSGFLLSNRRNFYSTPDFEKRVVLIANLESHSGFRNLTTQNFVKSKRGRKSPDEATARRGSFRYFTTRPITKQEIRARANSGNPRINFCDT